MELRPSATDPDLTELSFDSYREYMTLRDFTFKAFSGFFLRSIGIKPQMEFPYVESVTRERLERDAARLRRDAQFVVNHNHPQAVEISGFRNGMAHVIESYLTQTAA